MNGVFYAVRAEMIYTRDKFRSGYSRAEAGLNTSTVALRVVGGDEKEVSNLRQ
jgi:hypothetical protein